MFGDKNMFILGVFILFLYVVIFAMILQISMNKKKVEDIKKLKKVNMRKEVYSSKSDK